MTLKEVLDKLNEIAIKQPEINEIIDDGNIYHLNEKRNAKYAVFCAVQNIHTADLENATNTFQFWLYYVDRLTSDKDNKIEVQSTAIECLKNILRTFSKETDAEYAGLEFHMFTDSFDGLCAGAYASIGIITDDDGCTEIF